MWGSTHRGDGPISPLIMWVLRSFFFATCTVRKAMGNAVPRVRAATNYAALAESELVGPYPSTNIVAGSSLWASSPCVALVVRRLG